MISLLITSLIPLIKPFLQILTFVGFTAYLKSHFPNISFLSMIRMSLAFLIFMILAYLYSFFRSVLYGSNKGLIT